MHLPTTTASTRILLILSLAASSAAAQTLLGLHGEQVLAAGDPAPGIAGATIYSVSNPFDSPHLDQNGAILFRSRLAGAVTGADDRAYYFGHSNGNLQLVLRASDQAPGCPPGVLLRSASATAGSVGLQQPKLSPFGELIFFRSKLNDATGTLSAAIDTGLFYGPVMTPTLLAREGDQVPFLPAGVFWGEMDNTNLSIGQFFHVNANGTVLFHSPLTGAVTTGDDAVIVTGLPGGLQIVSREGDVLPDGSVVSVQGTTPTSSVVLAFANQLNANNQVLHEMRFSITTGTATTANDRALAVWSGGVDTIIVREGDPAVGTVGASIGNATGTWFPAGVSQFTTSGITPLNSPLTGGDVVGTTNDSALYLYAGGWNLVMRKGSLAPGMSNLETITTINDSSVACNDAGQVAFLCSLAGPTVTTTNDSALYFGTIGNLTPMAREGDPVVATGLTGGPWTYQSIASGGTATPRLNERGELLWQPSIGDGVNIRTITLSWTTTNGWVCVSDANESLTTILGTATISGFSTLGSTSSTDGGVAFFNNAGDWAVTANLPAPLRGAIVRGHAGALIQKPASISTGSGGTQNFVIDCGAARAFHIYALIGSQSGTRPGTPSPLGPQTIPLNFDAWTTFSLNLANTPIYSNSLSFLDASGKGAASFNIPSFPSLAGTLLHHAVVTLDINLVSTFVSEPTFVKLY